MSKIPTLRHPMKSTDLQKVIEAHGFTLQQRDGVGTTHMVYRNGSYVFVFTFKGRGRDSSPAQVTEFKKLLKRMQNDRKYGQT